MHKHQTGKLSLQASNSLYPQRKTRYDVAAYILKCTKMLKTTFDTLNRWGRQLASPDVVYFTLIWLMVILVVGTVSQKYVGLYLSQNTFFYSWLIMVGPVPLPGGMPTLGLLTIALIAKLIFKSEWSWQKSGIIITHIGALLLMLGGFLTFVQSHEGSMILTRGAKSSYMTDYHARELAIIDAGTNETLRAIPFRDLRVGKTFHLLDTPVTIEVVKVCANCTFPPREGDVDAELRGRARNFDIAPIPPEKEDEDNHAAIQFRIAGATDVDTNGIHFSTEMIDKSPQVTVGGHTYNIALRRARTKLPFEIELVDFEKTYHPGTEIAKTYKSEVVLRDQGAEWRSLIQMNEPLRYRGYTLYQASFVDNGTETATVLAVVKNAGRLFPYISSIVMCIGLLIHMALQLPKLINTGARRAGTLVAVLLMLTGTAQAASPAAAFDQTDFRQIPILDHGRLKPMDTFARSWLEEFTGRDNLQGMAAIDWLSELIMTPEMAFERPVFRIPNPAVQQALQLPVRPGHRYSYTETVNALRTHARAWESLLKMLPDDLSPSQKQLLELLGRVEDYAQIAQSLAMIAPDFVVASPTLAKQLGVDDGAHLDYLTIQGHQPVLDKLAQRLAARVKTAKNASLSIDDQMLMAILGRMQMLDKNRDNDIFRVIPPQWDDQKNNLWTAPWAMTTAGKGSPEAAALLAQWRTLMIAYRTNDVAAWKNTAHALRQSSLDIAGKIVPQRIIGLEVLYNQIAPFNISFALYLAGLVAVMAGFLFAPTLLTRVAIAFVAAAIAFHILGLGTRMVIMQRPPVTNLYGSVIFVGLVVASFGMILEYRLRNRFGLVVAAVAGTFLQLVGIRFDAEGDQMGMLVAVLDTNFWLGTHVVMMTIGYGCALVGGIMGHVYLVTRVFWPNARAMQLEMYKNMRGVILVAVFFTSLGTILGGIWADQSWGRFWGWDPKENGALLIVLWLVWMVHGRLSGRLQESGYSAAMAFTLVIVACAWFGVNLLGVGLHSYGFTQSAMAGFITFCSAELILISAAYAVLRVRDARAANAP